MGMLRPQWPGECTAEVDAIIEISVAVCTSDIYRTIYRTKRRVLRERDMSNAVSRASVLLVYSLYRAYRPTGDT